MRILLAALNSQFVHSSPALYALRRGVEAAPGCASAELELHTAEYSITMSNLRIMEDIYRQRPDVLAFSVYIWNIAPLRDLICDLRQLLPETCISSESGIRGEEKRSGLCPKSASHFEFLL